MNRTYDGIPRSNQTLENSQTVHHRKVQHAPFPQMGHVHEQGVSLVETKTVDWKDVHPIRQAIQHPLPQESMGQNKNLGAVSPSQINGFRSPSNYEPIINQYGAARSFIRPSSGTIRPRSLSHEDLNFFALKNGVNNHNPHQTYMQQHPPMIKTTSQDLLGRI
jgi:hypothetical protein